MNASQVILTQLPGQELHLEVFDKDMDMKDDFMGRSLQHRLFLMEHKQMTNSNLTIF